MQGRGVPSSAGHGLCGEPPEGVRNRPERTTLRVSRNDVQRPCGGEGEGGASVASKVVGPPGTRLQCLATHGRMKIRGRWPSRPLTLRLQGAKKNYGEEARVWRSPLFGAAIKEHSPLSQAPGAAVPEAPPLSSRARPRPPVNHRQRAPVRDQPRPGGPAHRSAPPLSAHPAPPLRSVPANQGRRPGLGAGACANTKGRKCE